MNQTNLVFFDIETGPNPVKPECPPFKVSNGATKPETIQKQKDEYEASKDSLIDAAWRKQSLDSMSGRIICICYAIGDGEVISLTGDEKTIMLQFELAMRDIPYPTFVTFNGKRFDLVWMLHRCVKYKLHVLKAILPHTRNANNVEDVMEMFAGSAYGSESWYSLDSILTFLGIENKSSHGSEIHDMYINGEIHRIVGHCSFDVLKTREIYKLIK